MATDQKTHLYFPALDGLRFIAFLMVFLYHSPSVETLPLGVITRPLKLSQDFGWAGVDLFLGLSAFLLTKLLVTEFQQNGRLKVKDFYIRRLLRI